MKPTVGFTTINRDDTRRQKVDHSYDQALRANKGGRSGLGAEPGRKHLRGEILRLHDFAGAHSGNADPCGVVQPEHREQRRRGDSEMDSSTARDNGFADMSDLFYRARRRAVDLNGALDDLLKEL